MPRASRPSLQRLLGRLRAHRRSQAEEKLAAGPLYADQDLLFAGPTGAPLDHRNIVVRHFKPALEKVGLDPSIRFYDLPAHDAQHAAFPGISHNMLSPNTL